MKTLATWAFITAVTMNTASAQEMEPSSQYPTVLNCYPVATLAEQNGYYEELPLFTAYATLNGTNSQGEPLYLEGPVIFSVNQITGTWIMAIANPMGELCNVASGYSFEPYAE